MLVFRDTETKGRGIFAQQDFATGDLIERAAVIVIPKQQVKLITKTVLLNYGSSGLVMLNYFF
jgi:hypothetical protein